MTSAREIDFRVGRVRELMRAEGVSALYASKPEDVLYLTGKTAGRLVLTQKGGFLWVRGLYARLYRSHYSRLPYTVFDIEAYPLKRFFAARRFKRVGVSSPAFDALKRLRRTAAAPVKASNAVSLARMVKTPYELRRLKAAAAMARAAMNKTRSLLRSGSSELSVTAEVEGFLRKKGSESPPFESGMLLASGPASADIHARPSRRRIRRGLVLVDLGAKQGGYFSDMTRTFCVGRPTKQESLLMEFVENLRDECIDMACVGLKASELFEYAKTEIEKKRLKFYHSLGHGIGLEVHESPNLGPKSRDVLEENLVFTVEPGVYLPGKFGVRFEDTVVLKKNGARKIT